jgi:hypothetical protein
VQRLQTQPTARRDHARPATSRAAATDSLKHGPTIAAPARPKQDRRRRFRLSPVAAVVRQRAACNRQPHSSQAATRLAPGRFPSRRAQAGAPAAAASSSPRRPSARTATGRRTRPSTARPATARRLQRSVGRQIAVRLPLDCR